MYGISVSFIISQRAFLTFSSLFTAGTSKKKFSLKSFANFTAAFFASGYLYSAIPLMISPYIPPDKIYKSEEYSSNSSYFILFLRLLNLLYESEESFERFLYPFLFFAINVKEYSPSDTIPSKKTSRAIIGFIPDFIHFL